MVTGQLSVPLSPTHERPQRWARGDDRSGFYWVVHRPPHRELLSTGTQLAPRKSTCASRSQVRPTPSRFSRGRRPISMDAHLTLAPPFLRRRTCRGRASATHHGLMAHRPRFPRVRVQVWIRSRRAALSGCGGVRGRGARFGRASSRLCSRSSPPSRCSSPRSFRRPTPVSHCVFLPCVRRCGP